MDHRMRILSQEALTPKRIFLQQQQQSTVHSKMMPTIYSTPDRIVKSPFRATTAVNLHSFNDGDMLRHGYPQSYQSSQVSVLQELSQAKEKIAALQNENEQYKRSHSPMYGDPTQKLLQKISHLEQDLQLSRQQKNKDDKELENYKRFYQQYYGNKQDDPRMSTDRNKISEKQQQEQAQLQKALEIMKEQQQKLSGQLEDYKSKLQDQQTKSLEVEKKYKYQKQSMKSKEKEIEILKDKLYAYEQRSMSQQRQKEYFDGQMEEFNKAYKDVASLNDELTEENSQLKFLLLQMESYQGQQKYVDYLASKKHSEQDFQQNIKTQEELSIKDLVDMYLLGTSEELLQISNDQNVLNAFEAFRESFSRLLNMLQSGKRDQEEGQFRLSEVRSAEFSRAKHQDEEVIGISDLIAKSNSILSEIHIKKEQLSDLDNDESRAQILRSDIDQLEKEYDGIQILITEQSDIFDKSNVNNNLHRNSIISFDQNFDTYSEQPY